MESDGGDGGGGGGDGGGRGSSVAHGESGRGRRTRHERIPSLGPQRDASSFWSPTYFILLNYKTRLGKPSPGRWSRCPKKRSKLMYQEENLSGSWVQGGSPAGCGAEPREAKILPCCMIFDAFLGMNARTSTSLEKG